MALIELQNVSKQFGSVSAVSNVSLTIQEHERFVLFGRSGAGKSTLLRLIAGLERPDHGHILFDNQDVHRIPAQRRGVAMLGQDAALYPQLSVFQNLKTIVKQRHASKRACQERIEGLLKQFHIEHVADNLPSQLSGGEGQRAALAKAMAAEHKVLLLDEPLSQLDNANRESAIEALDQVTEQFAPTMIMVSHDPMDALRFADRIGVMHEGRLVDVGEVMDVYHRPRCRISGQLLSPFGMNWIDQQTSPRLWQKFASEIESDSEVVSQRYLGIRGEKIRCMSWSNTQSSAPQKVPQAIVQNNAPSEPSCDALVLDGRTVKAACVGFAGLIDVEVEDGCLRCVVTDMDLMPPVAGQILRLTIRQTDICTVSR